MSVSKNRKIITIYYMISISLYKDEQLDEHFKYLDEQFKFIH